MACAGVLLFPGTGSVTLLCTEAALDSDAVPDVMAGLLTTTDIVTVAPAATVPRLHTTLPVPWAQEPWVDVAETNATSGGRFNVAVAAVAAAGPLLATVAV